MSIIRFKPEPGGKFIPGSRFREYAQASYTEQAVSSLLQDVLALGSEKLEGVLQERSLHGRVKLDPVTRQPTSMNVIWGSARYQYEVRDHMRQYTMQVWSIDGGGDSITATRYADGSLEYTDSKRIGY